MKKYSFLSNLRFAYGPVWKEKRIFIRDMILEILFSVLVPLGGSVLSAMVIQLLGNGMEEMMVVGCIMAAFVGYALVNAAQTYIFEKHMAHNIEIRLELFFVRVLKKQLRMSLEKSERADVRLLQEKAMMAICNNWEGIEGFFRYGTRLGVGIFGLLVYSFIAGTIHPLIMVLLMLLSILGALIDNLPQWYHNRTKEQKAKYAITMRYVDRVVDDVPAGKDIRVFGLKPWLTGKYDAAIMGTRHLDAGKNLLAYVGAAAEITFSALRDGICYLYLIHCLQNGMAVSDFVFYLGIIGGFSGWFNRVSRNLVQMRNCSMQICDIRRFLDEEEEDNSQKRIPGEGFRNIDVEFRHVSYWYENSTEPVLEDVSFHIAPGEHIALVGLNGAGKSTLAKLMTGLYLPTKGEILINGIPTSDLNLQEYFKHQAAVFQENFLLAYSIAENVALQGEIDEKRIWECLDKAGLREKVESLPDGLNTYLGKDLCEQGISLSGGENQKLLLARALYRKPSLILLDEPTSALDALAESEIYEVYNRTLQGITTLFISHRLASTRFCDRIILLSEGRIAEEGSHDKLMEQEGLYYDLFKVQSQYYEKEDTADVCQRNVEISGLSDEGL